MSFPAYASNTVGADRAVPGRDRLRRQRRQQHPAELRRQGSVTQPLLLPGDQHGRADPERHQVAVQPAGRTAGRQRRHEPPAAVHPGRDRLRAGRRPRRSGLLLPNFNANVPSTMQNDLHAVVGRGQGHLDHDRGRVREGLARASGRRAARRSRSASRTRRRTPTTTPTRRSSPQTLKPLGFNGHGRTVSRRTSGTATCPPVRSPAPSTGARVDRPRTASTTAGWTTTWSAATPPRATRVAGTTRRPQTALTSVRRRGDAGRAADGHQHAREHRVHPGAGDPAALRRGLVRVQHEELHRLADAERTPTSTRRRTRRTSST